MIFFILWGVIIAAVIGLTVWKATASLRYPKTWVHIGTPPPGFDIAIQTIKDNVESVPKRWGGKVEWVDGPFAVTGTPRAAGALIDEKMPYIKLMKMPFIEQTALTHEIRHYIDHTNEMITTHPPAFYDWVNMVNAKIAKMLGR